MNIYVKRYYKLAGIKERMIPQYLSKAISNYDSKIKADNLKERLETQKEIKDKKDFWKSEKKLCSQKTTLYERIIEWKNEFKVSKDFRRLFRNESEIIVYHDSWGHEKPRYEPCDGCWSRMYLDRHGHLKYSAGYKWTPTGPSFFLTGKSVSKLSHAYLASLYRHIESGGVYRAIRDEINEKME